MGSKIREFQQALAEIFNPKIQNLLRRHLTESASSFNELFTKQFPQDRANLPMADELSVKVTLRQIFSYAPIAVCNLLVEELLATDTTELIGFLTKTDDANESALAIIMHHAPVETRTKLVEKIRQMDEEQLIKLLFNGNLAYPDFRNFLKLVNINDNNSSIAILKTLTKINPKTLFAIFHTISFSGFIELFKKCPPENLALELLKLLDQFDGQDLAILIKDRDTGFFNFLQDQNLLHLVFKQQSPRVITELLRILRKLGIEEIKALLLQRDGIDDLTPIEYAFARYDKPEVSVLVAQTLQENDELKPLFTKVSTFQPYSIMHKAAALGQSAVVAYYLEQEDAQLEHKSASSESMLELAKQNGQDKIIAYFAALPLLKLIKTADHSQQTQFNEQVIISAIQADPAILDCRWTEGKTVLHFAAAKGLFALVRLLQQQGVSGQLSDNNNLTPIDEALRSNQLIALKELIALPESTSKPLMIETLAEILHKTIPPIVDYEELQDFFRQARPDSLENYCNQQSDCYIYFLKTIGELLALKDSSRLLDAVKTYIYSNLQQLSVSTKHAQHNALQLQLLVLVFSIPASKRLALLSLISLSEQEKMQLGLVIVRALVQPLINNSLSTTEQLDHYQFLKQLFPSDPALLEKIASIHFCHSDLTKIPVEIILELARVSSTESLLNYCKQRTNPILVVLTLEKLLGKQPLVNDSVDALFKQLALELKFIRNAQSSAQNSELILLLNLVSEPELKAFIRATFKEPGEVNPDQQIQQFFKAFSKQSILRANSLLADLFNDYACSRALLNQPNHQGLTALLAVSTPEAIGEILQNLRPYFRSPARSKLQSQALVTWMQKLENKTHRLALCPQILQLEALYDHARELAKPITNAEHYLLYTALKNYAKALRALISITFNIHLDQTDKANNAKLTRALEQLALAFNAVIAQSDSLSLGHYPALESELSKLKTKNTIAELSDGLKKACIQIDELQKPVTISTSTTAVAMRNKENLNQHLIQGIVLNPQADKLKKHLFDWGLHCRDYASNHMLFEPLYRLIQIASEDYGALEQQSTTLLHLKNKISVLAIELQRSILVPPTSIKKVLGLLYEAEKEELMSLFELCSIIELDDFKKIVNYVLKAKAYDLPLDLLIAEVPKESEACLSASIKHVLDSIDSYTTQAISYKILRVGTYRKEEDILTGSAPLNVLVNKNLASAHPQALTLLIASYMPVLQDELESPDSRVFVHLLSNLFKNTKLTVINDCICQMAPELLDRLISHCLSGLNHSDSAYDESSSSLLNLLCQSQSETNSRSLALIKSRLREQDLSLLKNKKLIALAESILGQSNNHGFWIQQLLTSADFVAAAKPRIIKALCNRYGLISMTLTQAEFEQENSWLQDKMTFYSHHHNSMTGLERTFCDSSDKKVQLLEKRRHLLRFRADDSTRALLSQLENSCIEKQKTEPEIADKALATLYSYYNESLTSIRSDLLFKIADYLVSKASGSQRERRQTENRLFAWLMQYLPLQNFELFELASKQTLLLYNAAGRKIGFINEANYAMTFVNDMPRPLLGLPGITPELCFYDSEGRLIGRLTATGEVKRSCQFQEKISALLLAKISATELEQSAAVMDLLINNLLTENTLTILYENSEADKHEWQTQQLNTRLINSNKLVQRENFEAIVKHQQSNAIFSLLAELKLAANAEQLFIAIVNNDIKRQALLSEDGQKSAYRFFEKHDSELIFANFLVTHYDKPWFNDVLELFANFAQSANRADLLCKSLELLSARMLYTKKALTQECFDNILKTLLNSEICAAIIWRHFLQANSLESIQQVDKDLAKGLSSFFNKAQLMPAIKMLNMQNNWSLCTYQYRLVLLILAKQRECLFIADEQKRAWSGEELKQMSMFIKKHFVQRANPDKNFVIGKETLGELIVRCANYGLTDLFYNECKFDPAIAILKLERSLLNALAARSFISPEFKSRMKSYFSSASNAFYSILNWFDNDYTENHKIAELLNKNQALIDWKELSNQTWSMTDSWAKMPLISAYLINYSGSKQALLQLIDDYLGNKRIQAKSEYLHHIAVAMAKLPQRDFSVCIFSKLEELISQSPSSLDRKLLADMAKFYSLRYCGQSLESPAAELQLLKHFGCQQKYELLVQSCDLLESEVADSDSSSLLREIETQAKIEAKLSKYLSSWYYPIYQFFLRLWNYGLADNRLTCQFVPHCEKESTYSSPTKAPETIRTPTFDSQFDEEQIKFAINPQSLKARYQQFLENYSLAPEPAVEKPLFVLAETPNLFRPASSTGIDNSQTNNKATEVMPTM